MPAATTGGDSAEVKSDREEILWQALKEHIMRERQKKKEGYTSSNCDHNLFHILLPKTQNKKPKLKRRDCERNEKHETDRMP